MTVTILDDNNSTFGQVRIDRADVRVDTFRASGPGGQHRNKTSSGVRLTHLPTGTVVTAVEDRSQHVNRDVAWRRLHTRLNHDQASRAAAAGNQARVDQLEDTTRSWTWTGWRDEVKSSTGARARMGSALAGKLGPLLRR